MISPIERANPTYSRHDLRGNDPENLSQRDVSESLPEKNFAERAIAKHPAISLVIAGAVGIALGCLLKRHS